MTHEQFEKAFKLNDEINELKTLIGIKSDLYSLINRRIRAVSDDEELRQVIEKKIERLEKQFESL